MNKTLKTLFYKNIKNVIKKPMISQEKCVNLQPK